MMLGRIWTTLVQWCVAARFRNCGVGNHCAVQDQKANAALTDLVLWRNDVGDAGATALADALQATVLNVWAHSVPGMCTLLPQMLLCKVV